MKRISSCCLALLFVVPTSVNVAFSQAAPKPRLEGIDKSEIVSQDKLLAIWRSYLSSFNKLADDPKHVPAPKESEYFEYMRDTIKKSISIIKKRAYFEKNIVKKAAKDWTRRSTLINLHDYESISRGLYIVENDYRLGTPAVAKGQYEEIKRNWCICRSEDLKTRYDPKEFYKSIAATFRPKPILPPFRIGKVTVEDRDRNYRWTDAGRNLVNARNGLHDALKDLKGTRADFKEQELKYWQTYEDLQVRLRPLRRAYEAAIAPAVNVEKARVAGMNGRAEIERQKIGKRIDQIDRHLPLLDSTFTGPNAAQYAAERRKALLRERAELQAKLGAISGQTKAKTGPQLRADSPDAKQLYETWQSEKRLSDIRMAQVGRDLDVAARHRDQDENAVTKAEVALGKATEAWSTAQRGQTVRLEQISSDDFRAKFISGLPDIGKLNRLIDHARFNLRIAESAHAVRRRDLVKWGDVLTRDSESLARSGYESAVAQASVEAAEQIKSFVGKLEDPPAAFADAAVNIFWNIATPPTIYDAETGPLPHSRKDIAAFATGEAEGMGKTAINKTRSSVRATIAHTREVTIPQLLAEQTARIEAGDFSGLSTVEDALSRQQAQLERIQKDFAAKVLKKGAGTFVKKMGGEVLGNLGKSIIKAEIKKGIAEFVEGPALYKYAEDQMELMLAGRRLAMARTVADQLRGQLAQLQKQRAALLDKYARYDASTGSLVEKNRQFLAQADYAFYLYPKDDDKSSGKDSASGQLKARVFLQGIELKQEPSPRGLKFTIRSEDEAKFNTPTLPEKLAMTIKLQ